MSLNPISIPNPSGKPPVAIVVMLHGWGANADDLASLAPLLDVPDCLFLFPNAPFDHPDVYNGRAWYALDKRDFEGLEDSRQQLRDWLLSLPDSTGIGLEKTVLCGFSQGGAMALDVGLSLPLAGICALSGYLHSEPRLVNHTAPPIAIVHGIQDYIVPISAARDARDLLSNLGVTVDYHELNMGHEIPIPVLTILRKFLRDVLEV